MFIEVGPELEVANQVSSRNEVVKEQVSLALSEGFIGVNYFRNHHSIRLTEGLIIMKTLLEKVSIEFFQSGQGLNHNSIHKFYSNIVDFFKFLKINRKTKRAQEHESLRADVAQLLTFKIRVIMEDPFCSRYLEEYLSGLVVNTVNPFLKEVFNN